LSQSITIGDNIKLSVLSIEGDRVSLGVEAPREVRVFRTELLEGTQKANVESLQSNIPNMRSFPKRKPPEPKEE
jgi:carbon storage regulator